MTKILNINLIGGRTGTNQLIKTISEGLGKDYETDNLVGYGFGNDKNTTSLYKTNNSKLYRNFRYKLAVGLNFLFDRMTPGCINLKFLHNYERYKEADIIHLHSIQGGYFNWEILPEISKEKKIIMTCHDDWIVSGNDKNNLFFQYKKNFQYKARKSIFEKSNITYVGVSNWMSNKIKNDGIIGNNKAITIYNGINTKIFNKKDKKKCREDLGLPLNKKIIVSIAGAGKKSNVKGIKYVDKLKKEFSERKDLLFISIGNNEYKKISDNELEVGFVSSEIMSKYFSAADLFLYPTLADSFGLVVAECISCGCPIVTFETGGVPEIVHHKKNGYVARYRDYEDLIKGFNRVFDNINKLEIKLDDCFKQESMVNGYKKLYHSLLEK